MVKLKKKMMFNKSLKYLSLTIVGIVVFSLSFLAASFYLKVGGLGELSFDSIKDNIPKLFVVESGSMEPAIKTGSIVITEPSGIYAQNDIISFKSGKKVITHRIMYRSFPDGVNAPATYQTSGDANEDFDPFVVKQDQVIGKVVYDIPYLGYVANFAKQPYGFILLVIVPATIVIYEELKSLFLQILDGIRKFLNKNRKENRFAAGRGKRSRNFKGGVVLSKASILLPIFGAVFVFTGLAASFFSDKETSANNLMQAGEWGPKIAQTLVINEVMPFSNCNLGGDKSAAWIEIWNGFSTPVDLKNYKLNDGTNTVDIVNAVTILQPNTFALLAKDNSVWSQCFTPALGALTINLGNNSPLNLTTGIIKIIDTDGISVLDHVEYPDNLLPDTSIERVVLGQDSETGDGWTPNGPADFSVQCPSTPGSWTTPTGGCPVVINELMWPGSSESTADEWLELRNMTGNPIDLTGWKIDGAAAGGFVISSGTLPPNGYFLISNFADTNSNSVLNITPDVVDNDVTLPNKDIKYVLKNNLGSIVDTADDGEGNPLTGVNTGGADSSMERNAIPGDGSLVGSWHTATSQTNIDSGKADLGTPKAANSI